MKTLRESYIGSKYDFHPPPPRYFLYVIKATTLANYSLALFTAQNDYVQLKEDRPVILSAYLPTYLLVGIWADRPVYMCAYTSQQIQLQSPDKRSPPTTGYDALALTPASQTPVGDLGFTSPMTTHPSYPSYPPSLGRRHEERKEGREELCSERKGVKFGQRYAEYLPRY